MRVAVFFVLLLATVSAQEKPRVLFYPKPINREYKPPMKPVVRFAEVKAKHKGHASWREPVIDDGNSVSFLVQDPAGTKLERRMYPDSAAWFAVLEGEMRFEVERPDGSIGRMTTSEAMMQDRAICSAWGGPSIMVWSKSAASCRASFAMFSRAMLTT